VWHFIAPGDAVGLSEIAGNVLTDTRRGKNGRHGLVAQFRQSVFGRLGGYEDMNDADRLSLDPVIYEFLEAEAYTHAIRLKANTVLQESIAHLLTRPVGRPPNHVRRYYASFSYQAGSWKRKRRIVAKVEWHPGELYPRVGFIVTNLSRPAEGVGFFYNQRGKAEQYIKEGKTAIKWTRLSCRRFRDNAVRLQLHTLAYNLANFMRTLALPEEVEHWSLTTLREKLVKISAKVVRHGRYVTFQLAGVAL